MTEEPLNDRKDWCEDTPIRSMTKLAQMERSIARAESRENVVSRTVIPVPQMPTLKNPQFLTPVVRSSTAPPPPRRLARGTDQRSLPGPTTAHGNECEATLQLPLSGKTPARRSAP